jgi:hypothetical protein
LYAVGGRPDHGLRGNVSGSARPVIDDEWLAETLRQPLADQPRDDVD